MEKKETKKWVKQKQEKITPNIGRFSHFQMRRKPAWKLRIRHENFGKGAIYPNFWTFSMFCFTHSIPLTRVDLSISGECNIAMWIFHLFLFIFHKFVCFVTKIWNMISRARNLVLTKIDIKGRRAASAVWRELKELLEEKIRRYLLSIGRNIFCSNVWKPFMAVCL